MDAKDFIREINILSAYLKVEKPNWSTRRKTRKQKKLLNKMIAQKAQEQADIVYRQTVNLYNEFVESNLK